MLKSHSFFDLVVVDTRMRTYGLLPGSLYEHLQPKCEFVFNGIANMHDITSSHNTGAAFGFFGVVCGAEAATTPWGCRRCRSSRNSWAASLQMLMLLMMVMATANGAPPPALP